MATATNRGKYTVLAAALATLDLRACLITGTSTGAEDPDLNTVADLDAVAGVGIHTERLTVTGEAVAEDDANDRANLTADNLTFAAAPGVDAYGYAIYDEGGGTDNTRTLIGVAVDGFTAGIPVDGGLTITIGDLLRQL